MMANLTWNEASEDLANGTDVTQIACKDRYHEGIDNGDFTTATKQSYVITIVFNSIMCPFTVLLNVLVIWAVKRKPSLQNNANILLACLAATDVLSGFLLQPSFIIWKAFQLNGVYNSCKLRHIHNWLLSLVSLLSVLHLSLVTAERLIAIKYSLRYLAIVTRKKICASVTMICVFSLLVRVGIDLSSGRHSAVFLGLVVITCVLFILICYAILFHESIRHNNVIRTHQQPRDEAGRFARENKAFKTTVFVVGALLGSFLPMALLLLFRPKKGYGGLFDVLLPWARTLAMLNSVFNPLVYCWQQKEMRKFVLNMPTCTHACTKTMANPSTAFHPSITSKGKKSCHNLEDLPSANKRELCH